MATVLSEDKLRERILELKKELDVVIMAHNYQRPEVQGIADITGNSRDRMLDIA